MTATRDPHGTLVRLAADRRLRIYDSGSMLLEDAEGGVLCEDLHVRDDPDVLRYTLDRDGCGEWADAVVNVVAAYRTGGLEGR